MRRWVFLWAGIMACVFAPAVSCRAQDATGADTCVFMKLQGKIVAIDWVGSTIVVKDKDNSDEVTFLVSRESKITRGADTISFSDLNIEDQVTIEYCDSHFAGLKALNITVKI